MLLDASYERGNERIGDISEEHLVDDESDREDYNRRQMRSDKSEEHGTLQFRVPCELLHEGKGTIGMEEYIAPIHESDEYRDEEYDEHDRESDCLEYRPQSAFWKGYDDSTIHRNENRQYEYEIDR